MIDHLFPTTVIGSMPRPKYIKDLITTQVAGDTSIDFQAMMDTAIPHVIQMQECAGVDIISDGEWRRKSYIGVISDICSGFELEIREFNGEQQTWHTVTSEIQLLNPGQFAREASFLKKHTTNDIKVAMPSPYLLAERMWSDSRSSVAYPNRRDFAESLVPILRQELILLRNQGVAIAQFDDPQLCMFTDPKIRAEFEDPDSEARYSIDLLNRICDGIDGIKLALHLCRRNKGRSGWMAEGGYQPILPMLNELEFHMIMFEFAMPASGDKRILKDISERFDIGLGCVDCRQAKIDSPDEIADRVRESIDYIDPNRITLHPDCGFAPGSAAEIPLDEAYAKLKSEVLAAKLLRSEYV